MPDIFSWTFGFTVLNVCHLVHAVYVMRPVRLNPELEDVYVKLFRPFGVLILCMPIFTGNNKWQ